MMNRGQLYRCSFPSGLRVPVEGLLARETGVTLDSSPGFEEDESSLHFYGPQGFTCPPYLQSLTLILAQNTGSTLEEGAHKLLDDATWHLEKTEARQLILDRRFSRHRGQSSSSGGTFALRTFREGKPEPLARSLKEKLEQRVGTLLGLRPHSQGPNLEVQLHLRQGGAVFLGIASPSELSNRDQEGKLPPSTVRILLELSQPHKDDVFLDPFAGSGILCFSRARLGPYRFIFAGDQDPQQVAEIQSQLREKGWEKKRKTLFPKVLDGGDLSQFDNAFVTTLVTDPPWGLYQGPYSPPSREALEALYTRFFKEAHRVLAPGGRLVLLIGRDSPWEGAIQGQGWIQGARYGVLISGRQATVALLRRQ